MEIYQDHIDTIILRQLNGEATKAEQQVLQEWLLENEENREQYDSSVSLWNDAAVLPYAFNKEAAWEKVAGRIQAHQASSAPAKIIDGVQFRKALALAACFMLALFSVWMFLSRSSSDGFAWRKITADENMIVALPDGSTVSLRKGSRLELPEGPYADARMARLDGEAFFEIKHDDARPFEVTTAAAVITDLGTSFLVRSGSSVNEVVVTEGSVRFSKNKSSSKHIILTAGQKGILSGDRFLSEKTTEENYRFAHTGKLVFKNTPLEEASWIISHHYRIPVTLDPALGEKKIFITAAFNNQDLEEVMDELKLTTGVEVTRIGGGFRLGK